MQDIENLLIAVLSVVIRHVVSMLRPRPDEKTMTLIRLRLSVFDNVIASRITSAEDRISYDVAACPLSEGFSLIDT